MKWIFVLNGLRLLNTAEKSTSSMLQKHMINAEKVYWRYSWLALGKLGTVNLLPWLHLDCNLNYKKDMYQRQ